MRRRAILGCFAVAVLAAACNAPVASTVAHTGQPAELIVFAAASLRDVLDAATAAYEQQHGNVTLIVATDSSAALRTQIEQGAAVDVFLSADATNPQALVDGGLVDREAQVFATTAVALVVPADNPAGIDSPADLAVPGVRIVAAGEAVPITRYATEVVENLAAVPGYPGDYPAACEANVVSREDNVRAVLAKVELGEADAGFVYTTDAAVSNDVRVIPLPEGVNVAVAYAGVVLAGAAEREEARRFLDWLIGADGQAVFADFGFGPP